MTYPRAQSSQTWARSQPKQHGSRALEPCLLSHMTSWLGESDPYGLALGQVAQRYRDSGNQVGHADTSVKAFG